MEKNKLIINKQNSHNVRKHWQLTIGSQYIFTFLHPRRIRGKSIPYGIYGGQETLRGWK